MTLFERVAQLLKAEVLTVLDRLETPEILYQQALEGGEQAIIAAREVQRQALAEQLRLQDTFDRAKTQAQAWEDRAASALGNSDENLAREALKLSLMYAQEANTIEATMEQVRLTVSQAKAEVQRFEAELKNLVTKKEWILAKIQASQAISGQNLEPEDESPLELFERMRAKADQSHYRAAASQILAEEETLARQFEQLKQQAGPSQSVKDKLAAMKEKLQPNS